MTSLTVKEVQSITKTSIFEDTLKYIKAIDREIKKAANEGRYFTYFSVSPDVPQHIIQDILTEYASFNPEFTPKTEDDDPSTPHFLFTWSL